MKPSVGMLPARDRSIRRWVIATCVCVALVSGSAGAAPVIYGLSGMVKPYDFAQDIAAARESAAGRSPYGEGFSAAHGAVLGNPVANALPFYPHPPAAILLVAPLASVPFQRAAGIWFALSLGLVVTLAALICHAVSSRPASASGDNSHGWSVAALSVALLLWPPVLYNLEKGQWSLLLAVLILGGWIALRRSSAASGVLLGAAAAIKVFPILLAGYLLFRDRRAARAFAATCLLGFLIPLALLGFSSGPAFVRSSQANVDYWQTWLAVAYSLHGLIARLFIGGAWATALIHAPTVGWGIEIALTVVALAVAAWCTEGLRDDPDGVAFAGFCILLVVLNPLSMGHNGVLLAFVVILLGRALTIEHSSALWASWMIGTLLVSTPKDTILTLCHVPSTPACSVAVVGLPFWGGVILYGVAIALARRSHHRSVQCAPGPDAVAS